MFSNLLQFALSRKFVLIFRLIKIFEFTIAKRSKKRYNHSDVILFADIIEQPIAILY